ncbi:hypothetical protein [Flavobacterium sp.]|uniref:hypothetical protein n=1 Tax=Flavobacterium sp. TaxID=239 RepID=UPI00262EE101|nr:hypothetical protein [Flavobacterium sp.]
MKRILFAVLCVSLAACSSDSSSDASGTSSGLKIKNITEIINYGGSTTLTKTGNFVYEGNILKSLIYTADNVKIDFLYAGDKITQMNTYRNNQLIAASSVTYDGAKLIRVANEGEKTEYQYVNDVLKSNTVSTYNNNQWDFYEGEEYAFDQNNVVEVRSSSKYTPTVSKSRYIHDDKKNPFSGMNPYLKYLLEFESFNPMDQNNRITQQRYASAASNDIVGTTSYQIQYNPAGYPTEIRKVNDANQSLLSKIVISYN